MGDDADFVLQLAHVGAQFAQDTFAAAGSLPGTTVVFSGAKLGAAVLLPPGSDANRPDVAAFRRVAELGSALDSRYVTMHAPTLIADWTDDPDFDPALDPFAREALFSYAVSSTSDEALLVACLHRYDDGSIEFEESVEWETPVMVPSCRLLRMMAVGERSGSGGAGSRALVWLVVKGLRASGFRVKLVRG